MKIAVCNGNESEEKIINKFLSKYFACRGEDYYAKNYVNGRDLLYELEEEYYDIIFLDTGTKSSPGIETAYRLRELNYGGAIILLSSGSDFAVEGYNVRADGYLQQPHSFAKFCEVMDRLAGRPHEAAYCIKIRSNLINIPYSEIKYIESINNRCVLHRIDGSEYNVYRRLSEIETELDAPCFLRSHQSYIVNMDYVKSVSTEFTLTDGSAVLIRRKSLAAIRRKYREYIDNKIRLRKPKQRP